MKLTLHFKRAKKEGLEQSPLSLITTTTATDAAVMGSPSHSGDGNAISNLEQQPEEEAHELSETLEPINPTSQSDQYKPPIDPDQENPRQVVDLPDEEEAEEEQDQDLENSGMLQSDFPAFAHSIGVVGPHVISGSDVPLASPTNHPRRPNKRKKGKGSIKKQQAIEKKLQTLSEKLNPVPFIPSKILDFARHEKLLKRLGLWDFVHLEFHRNNVRVDLIAQLIANYDPKLRSSYVNEFRIAVNRADLARAFKLPVRKEKSGNMAVEGVDLDCEALSEESIAFLEDFVSNWVLLHEDTWMMPTEVLNWTRAIKDGHPEKVDWAGLFWFMVEKELMKGEQLVDCYYASHLQYLIKSQREEVLAMEQEVVLREEFENVELDAEVKEEVDVGNENNDKEGDVSEIRQIGNDMLQGPNVELTLGQDAVEQEGMKDSEMMDVDECREDNEEPEQEQEQEQGQGQEQEQGQEQGQWLLDGKNDVGEHFMQRCIMEESRVLNNLEGRKEENDEMEGEEEEGEDEPDDEFDVVPNDHALEGDGLTGNFLQAMENTQITFGSQGQLHSQSSVDLLASRNNLQNMVADGPSFYSNNVKREIGHEHDLSYHTLNGSNKRLRIDGPWDHKPLDFGTCIEQMQLLMDRARMMYEEKEQTEEQSKMNQHILLEEVQKRDAAIDHLHKTKHEEIQKKEAEIYRLQRELYVMGNLVEDYRKALKQTDKAFAEYRQQCQLPEEPIYQDAGPGGIVLTTAEIEKQRLKQEEEYRMNCSILEQKAKEAEEGYIVKFGDYQDKLLWLDKKLTLVENDFKVLKDSYSKPKVLETEEKISQASECPPSE